MLIKKMWKKMSANTKGWLAIGWLYSILVGTFFLMLYMPRPAGRIYGGIGMGIGTLSGVLFIILANIEARRSNRPIIHSCKRKRVIAACTDLDYQLADQMRYLIAQSGTEKWMSSRPDPRLVAYFTDDLEMREALGCFWTGPESDYHKLATRCRVQQSELLVVENPECGHGLPVTLATFYKIAFGHDCYDAFEAEEKQ
jgi:hypothetical protein